MSEQRSVAVAQRLVMMLLAHDVTDAVLSPGSRSGPLALALHAADEQGLIRLHVRVDEREAGFLALGLAKASRRLVPVVTTSGTAVANLHPAMLEALHSRVPVLAVTADRPGRLRGTGANQTTDQRHIFPGVPFLDRVDAIEGGPAHLNLELDEPLLEPVEWDFPITSRPAATATPGTLTRLDPRPRTVVLAGDDAGPCARVLARDCGWPLLAEPSSGARAGDALSSYRLLLGHGPLADRIERVVSFGHPTLSRPVTGLLARADLDVVHVGDASTFPVPAGPRVTFTDEVASAGLGDADWLAEWVGADAAAAGVVGRVLADDPAAAPLRAARAVWDAVPPGGTLLVGASNPVRDLDLVAAPYRPGERRLVLANRGLAGIDGTLSTAIGAALARPGARNLALVGDLTFLHGSNGLLLGPAESRPGLTIVVVNDDGGSIFATLEQGGPEHAAAFERVWGTPTGARLGDLCRGFGVPHRLVDAADLAAALAEVPTGIEVVEVPVPRVDRRGLDARLRDAVASALGPPRRLS